MKLSDGCIYLLTNIVNGKYYVGQTINLKQRWRQHKSAVACGSECAVHRAIRKYGCTNFIIEQLATASSIQQLNTLERLWIIALRSYDSTYGYNETYGGENSAGFKHSPETRQKMSLASSGANSHRFGKRLSEEHRQKLTFLGKQHSAEAKHKIKEAATGRMRSEETRKKISEAMTGKPRSPLSEEQKRKISESLKGHIPWNKGTKSSTIPEVLTNG